MLSLMEKLKLQSWNLKPNFLLILGMFPSGLPWWVTGRESASRCRFYPWVRKIPGEVNGNPLQYACLRNPKDRGAWRATVHGVTRELDMTYCLNNIFPSDLQFYQMAIR